MISENVSLKPFNTFGIDVKATRFATFASPEELGQILKDNKNMAIRIDPSSEKEINKLQHLFKEALNYESTCLSFDRRQHTLFLNIGGI